MDTEQYLTKSTNIQSYKSSNCTPSDFYTLKSKDNNESHSSLLESTSVSSSDLGPMYNIIPVEGFETTCLDSISEPDMSHSTVTSDIDSPTVYFMDSMDRLKSGNDGSVEMQLIVEDDTQSENGIKNVISPSNNYKETTHKTTTPTCSIIIEGNKPYKMKSSTRTVASDPVSGSWVTLRHQKEDLKNKGHTWKKGSWSREEIQLLQQNISRYCQDRNISDPTEIIFQNCKVRRSRGDFYPTIAAGLNRSLFSVYRRVRRMYDVKNYKGRYSEEELEKLKELVQVHGRDWTVIAQHLGRSSDSVKDRCRLIAVNSTPLSRGKWTSSEEELLIDAVRDATKTERGVSVTEGIPWSLVAKMVKTRTEKQCRAKWLNYLNWKTLNGPKWTKDDDKRLVERVYNLNVSSENDIIWADLTKDWPSARSPQWLHFKWSNLRKVVQQYWDECPFVETVEILRKLYHANLVKLYDQPKQFFKVLVEKFRGVIGEKQLKPSERFTIAADQFLATLESNQQQHETDGDDKTTSFTVLSTEQTRNISPLLINSNQLLLRHQTTQDDQPQIINSLMVRSKDGSNVSSSKIDSSPSSCDIAWIPNDQQISLPQGTYSIASSLGDGLYVIEDEIITFGENGIYLPSVFHSQANEIGSHSTTSSSSSSRGGASSNDITLNSANTVFLPHTSGHRDDDDDDDGSEVFAATQLQVDPESPMLQISI